MVFEAVVFQDAHHRIYTHKCLSHKAVLIFPASPYLEASKDTFGIQGDSGISKLLVFAARTKKSVMPNPDKTFWRYMHQKPSYKFNAGKGKFFPLSFVPVIFYRKSNVSIVHADDAVIADGNPMGILSKVVNHRLCAVKRFLTIRNPFRIITEINQFFERIMVTVFSAVP